MGKLTSGGTERGATIVPILKTHIILIFNQNNVLNEYGSINLSRQNQYSCLVARVALLVTEQREREESREGEKEKAGWSCF